MEFFTATNTDPGGAFAYWHDILYGIDDLTGSQVFGWYDIGHTSNQVNAASRQQVFDWGLQAASVDLTALAHKIVVVNVPANHGYTGAGVLFGNIDSTPLEPTFMFHEMGHERGLDHSFGEQPNPCASGDSRPCAYCDSWDVMSAMCKSQDSSGRSHAQSPCFQAACPPREQC